MTQHKSRIHHAILLGLIVITIICGFVTYAIIQPLIKPNYNSISCVGTGYAAHISSQTPTRIGGIQGTTQGHYNCSIDIRSDTHIGMKIVTISHQPLNLAEEKCNEFIGTTFNGTCVDGVFQEVRSRTNKMLYYGILLFVMIVCIGSYYIALPKLKEFYKT